MKILVANDDGIKSRGLHELVRALSEVADVYVCAPNGQRSACSQSITLASPIEIQEENVPYAKKAYSISGTPADCVKLGSQVFAQDGKPVDMVFTGINHGPNLGSDTLYSGTVGAALEGNVCGIPAVAVSVESHDAQYFEYACMLAVDAARKAYGHMTPDTTLNINVPNVPYDEVKGVKYTVLGPREYKEEFDTNEIQDGARVYIYTGYPVEYETLPDNYDVVASLRGFASITPLQRDYTDYKTASRLPDWGIGDDWE